MTTTRLRPSVSAEFRIPGSPPFTRQLSGGRILLDELGVPYATATIDGPLIADEVDDVDPRDDVRVLITAGDEIRGSSRTFDLGLRSRRVDHVGRVVSLTLASDEARLMDYATLTLDSGARTYESTLRGVCNYVLGKIGAALSAGTTDANVTAYWPITNLVTNPSIEIDTTGWTVGVGASGIAPNAKAFSGTKCAHWQQTATGDSWIDGPTIAVAAGISYVWAAYFSIVSGAAGTAGVYLRFKNAAGTIIRDYSSPMVATSTAGWARASLIVSAPPGATQASLHLRHNGATGRFPAFDAAMFYQGTELVPYFDGATADTATYNYDWGLTAHASTSQRTPVLERLPEMFTWTPGTTAWDFLAPILSSAGLRLFCDESRVWRLVDPSLYTLPGRLTVSPATATRGEDTISREDEEVFATGVVCRYSWRDTQGIPRTAFDAAGTPDRVVVFEYEQPYPGPGAAAQILARRNGTGRSQDVTVLVDWTASPAMQASISLPATPTQIGRVITAEFSVGDDALMTITTRGLVETPPGAIDLLVGTIDGLVGTIDGLNPTTQEEGP